MLNRLFVSLFYLFIVLFNYLSITPKTIINYIEHQADNYQKNYLTFLINFNVKNCFNCSDNLLIKINLIGKDDNKTYRFENEVTLKGEGSIYATIPFFGSLEANYEVEMLFQSYLNGDTIDTRKFNLYQNESESFSLNNFVYESKNYVFQRVFNDRIESFKEKASIDSSVVYYLKNIINPSYIMINYNCNGCKNKEGYGVIYLENRIEGSNIPYIEGFGHLFPAKMYLKKDNIYSLSLLNDYYLDSKTMILYENFQKGLSKTNNLYIPSEFKEVNLKIVIEDLTLSGAKLYFEISAKVVNNIVGKCYDSQVCISIKGSV